jgi:hypothetical protein
LRREKQPEYLSKDQFFHDQRDRYRKNQSGYNSHECDCHLHMNSPLHAFHVRSIEWQSSGLNHVVEKQGCGRAMD